MKTPIYKGTPINSLGDLAGILNISASALLQLAATSTVYYRANTPIPKDDGSSRKTYRVLPRLKRVQRLMVESIFHQVDFPIYLQGSIKATDEPRDYIADASFHARFRITISDDIKDFFPSIKSDIVFKIWREFFGCPSPIAQILTQLTTYKGAVPQGASTSSYIANLVFWDKEHLLVDILEERGFYYTRYVDDINISTNNQLDDAAMRFVTTRLYGMLRSKGFKPNRNKRHVQLPSQRKTVHNLNINAKIPTMSKAERSQIRAAVKQCEEMAKITRSSNEYAELYHRAFGRLANMQRLHPNEARPYYQKLKAIQPNFN